ncbi:MAG: hypothetical protein UX22_C0021G0001, partial [Candidatus Jorgensenbacteria bacterium GW2011_GWA2_45_9]
QKQIVACSVHATMVEGKRRKNAHGVQNRVALYRDLHFGGKYDTI